MEAQGGLSRLDGIYQILGLMLFDLSWMKGYTICSALATSWTPGTVFNSAPSHLKSSLLALWINTDTMLVSPNSVWIACQCLKSICVSQSSFCFFLLFTNHLVSTDLYCAEMACHFTQKCHRKNVMWHNKKSDKIHIGRRSGWVDRSNTGLSPTRLKILRLKVITS